MALQLDTPVQGRWVRWTAEQADGLPSWRVVLAFPLLVAIALAVLVGLTVNGSSSGEFRSSLQSGRDPALVAGAPESIRSDEWNVAAPLTIAQVEQGLPARNRSLVGGQDAAVPQDLPRADWSVAFRPHLLGFLTMDLGHAAALRWWLPAATCLALAYVLGVSFLPRRPIVAALAALGFVASPFFQWWFQSVTFWPIAWGLAVAIALRWAARSRSRTGRWVTAAIAGYLTAVMAMGIYAPYIIPVVLVAVAIGIGTLIDAVRRVGPRILVRFVPLVLAGLAGSAVTVVWLRSKQRVVDGLIATVYPGERLSPPGTGGGLTVARTVASSFTESLTRHAGFLGLNSSEASTFFLLGAFALPMTGWLVVRRARTGRRQPIVLIAVSVAILVLGAYIVIPGWEPIAHLLLLDRTTDVRIRIGLGLASFVVLILLVRELPAERLGRSGRATALSCAALFVLTQVAIALAVLKIKGPGYLGQAAPLWWLWMIACGVAIAAVALGRPAAGVALFAVYGIVTSVLVNPVYLGIYDMRSTPVARGIARVDARAAGDWVPIGHTYLTALLTETDARSYAGIQGAPSRSLWRRVDPSNRYEPQWNRLANIGYRNAPGSGEPVVTNPAPDQILVDFDACSTFAQENVRYVLTDVGAASPCLARIATYHLPRRDVEILRVVPSGG